MWEVTVGNSERIEVALLKTFRRWRVALSSAIPRRTDKKAPRIGLDSITFSNGTPIELLPGQILVLTGPNNVGKSASLREIRDFMLKGRKVGPVLKSLDVSRSGTIEEFLRTIDAVSNSDVRDPYVRISGDMYIKSQAEKHYAKGFIGETPMSLFLSYLGAAERLELTNPSRRVNYEEVGPKEPFHYLELDEALEVQVSEIFHRAFGDRLFLNTVAGEKLIMHVIGSQENDQPTDTASLARWLSAKPRLQDQGDGVRSFVGLTLSLLIRQTSIVLIDEPEAFLHPPQVRRLAAIIKENTAPDSQIIVATHSDEMVRALIDNASDRVIIGRLTRNKNENALVVLQPDEVAELWRDPTLRVSDILSSLFHEAAVLCEGDSDARFYRALLDGTKTEEREADARFYSFGGKDRLPNVVRALRPLGVPLVVIVDIDVLQDTAKFIRLFEAVGGEAASVKVDVNLINEVARQRIIKTTGAEMALQLHRMADTVQDDPEITANRRTEISALARSASPWTQIKAVGRKAFTDSASLNAFDRVYAKAKSLGLIVVPEGELEGFCRTVSPSKKD